MVPVPPAAMGDVTPGGGELDSSGYRLLKTDLL